MKKRSLYKSMPDKIKTNRRRMFGEKIAYIFHRYKYRAQVPAKSNFKITESKVPAKRSFGMAESESAGKEQFQDSGV